MDKIRVAILGQGRSGRDIHAINVSQLDEFEIVAIAEPMADRRERAKQEYGCIVVADYKELFAMKDKIDLVVNCTMSHQHYPVTLEFLNNGFNVLCEKPLAKKAEEVDDLIRVSKEKGVVLAAFQQSRLLPWFVKAKEIMDSGILGRIIQVNIHWINGFSRRWDWQTIQGFAAGSLYNSGPHPVDHALNLLNYDGMPDVKCFMDRVNTFGDAEDYVKLILSAPGRPVIDVEISSCVAYKSFAFNVYAERGGLVSDGQRIDYKYYIPSETKAQQLISTPLKNAEGLPGYCQEDLRMHEGTWETAANITNVFEYNTKMFYKMLYSHMREGKELLVTPQQVRQQIAVMEEAHRQNPLSVTVDV